jgi:CRP-like cAMP-binding protein
MPVDGQVDRAVVRLAERKSDIASQLGMTPETMSRLMRTLSDQRVIEVEGYTVKVLDLKALRRLAES